MYLSNAREANRQTAALAQEFEAAGFTSAADALKDAALRQDAAIRRDEAALAIERAKARADARAAR